MDQVISGQRRVVVLQPSRLSLINALDQLQNMDFTNLPDVIQTAPQAFDAIVHAVAALPQVIFLCLILSLRTTAREVVV